MTSCCPGWVRYVKARYPQFLPQVSSSKSPQQMFGAIAKAHRLLFIVDASQTAGVFPIDMEAMGIDVVLVTDNELESLFACDTIAQSMLRVLGKRNRTCVRNARDRKLKLRRQLGLPLEPRRTFEAVGSPSHFGEE